MKRRTAGANYKPRAKRLLAVCAVLAVAAFGLSACGGGGGGGSSGGAPAPGNTLPPSSTLAQQCAPTNQLAPAGSRNASLDTEKRWLRSYMDEAYLWFDEVPTVDPTLPPYSNVGGARVGYLTFNDHIEAAEGQLVTAFADFARQGVTDLVLDLRYNGGGFLYIASQASYMIAGGARTSGRVFERLRFNRKRVADNNDPANALPFFALTSGRAHSGIGANQPLPQLNLAHVFILTTGGSCSASESIINGLRGIGVTVHLIGATTCGKPFGSVAKDNCGISYFPIEFQGTNDAGFGDFADGFAPTCAVADDLTRPLGDPSEGMLATALAYRATGACPAQDIVRRQAAHEVGHLVRSPLRENKFR